MKRLILLIAALCAFSTALRGDTSYLLIQGPFGAGDTVETYKWTINYEQGSLITGQDLLRAVFGVESRHGDYTDAFGGTYPYLTASSEHGGIGYIDFGSGSRFVESVTLDGVKVAQTTDYSTGWVYYVAGGSGSNQGGSYPSGSWTLSEDGTVTRQIADGSFDAFVFGNTFPAASIQGAENEPNSGNFTDSTVVTVIPEPGTAMLLLAGVGLISVLRRRRTDSV